MALAMAVTLLGCSDSGESNSDSESAKSSSTDSGTVPVNPFTGYPDSLAALGHSAITGEGTQAGGGEVKANSWATGTNPQVNSVYLRLLQKNPAVEDRAVNMGTGSADITSLAGQAQAVINMDPQPQLVLIATLDADIKCPASQDDFDAFGQALRGVLHELSAEMPGSRFFITPQISTPRQDATVYPRQARASLGGTGPCAFINFDGDVVPKELRRLQTAVAGFKAQVTTACAQTDRCSTDQSLRGWRMKARYSDDLNHLNLQGQAKWAEYVWGLLQEAQLAPAQ